MLSSMIKPPMNFKYLIYADQIISFFSYYFIPHWGKTILFYLLLKICATYTNAHGHTHTHTHMHTVKESFWLDVKDDKIIQILIAISLWHWSWGDVCRCLKFKKNST